MIKLKTLKELPMFAQTKYPEYAIKIKDLRAEAIKWIKDIHENREEFVNYKFDAETFIKHFFDITEEDVSSTNSEPLKSN